MCVVTEEDWANLQKNMVTSQVSSIAFPLSLQKYVTPTSFLETEKDVFRLVHVMSVGQEESLSCAPMLYH